MGMTNEQFQAYVKQVLRGLERAKEENEAAGVKNKTLDILIQDHKEQLSKP